MDQKLSLPNRADVDTFRTRLTAWRAGLPGTCGECRWFRPDLYWPGSASGHCTRRSIFEQVGDRDGCGDFVKQKEGEVSKETKPRWREEVDALMAADMGGSGVSGITVAELAALADDLDRLREAPCPRCSTRCVEGIAAKDRGKE